MIDLGTQETIKYWKSQEDPNLFRIITFIESVENWTLDGDEQIEDSLTKLGQNFDNLPLIDIGDLNVDAEIISVLSFIKLGRTLRILQLLDESNPGFSSRLIMFAEENCKQDDDACGIFLKRNLMFERLRLSSRVFAEDRFKMVIQAMEDEQL